ncbi:MAG: alpha/beta hydrolase fold domain-containing protein [Pseudonocardiaceae bacterium]|nr:alpha/beta hydrolase fold domain-containing protein [Pseudonocardiaceae bacterium]
MAVTVDDGGPHRRTPSDLIPVGPVPANPSVESVRLAEFFARRIRPLVDRWQPRGGQLRLIRHFADGAGLVRMPRGTETWPARYGSVRGAWVRAPGASPANGVVLHLHGGGFVFGSPRSHRALAYQISRGTGMPVFLPHYRRAPEHPFPAAPNDCLAAYQALLDRKMPPERIRVSGDSAGGHLAAGLLSDLARLELPMPASAALFSPLLDLSCARLTELDTECRDPFIAPTATERICRAYRGETPSTDPRLNVLEADKSGWPPVLIQIGGTECLRGDAERMAESLRAAGVHCELQIWPGQIHVFQGWAALPEARAATGYVGEFLTAAR